MSFYFDNILFFAFFGKIFNTCIFLSISLQNSITSSFVKNLQIYCILHMVVNVGFDRSYNCLVFFVIH
jgi:hypothetical protein